MDAPSREIPDIWVRTRRRGLFGLAVVAAAAVAAWAGRGTSRVVRPFEFEEDDEHVFGLANASASRLGNATVSGLRDDDTDVDGLCLDYCPNTTSANDAACRLCDLQKVVRFHNEYEDASGIPIGEGYYPYMYLVEMWKPTTAELNAFELGDEAVSRVRRVDWSGDDVGHAVGSRVTMIFETHGTRNVTVSMRVATTRGEELGFHVELAVTVRSSSSSDVQLASRGSIGGVALLVGDVSPSRSPLAQICRRRLSKRGQFLRCASESCVGVVQRIRSVRFGGRAVGSLASSTSLSSKSMGWNAGGASICRFCADDRPRCLRLGSGDTRAIVGCPWGRAITVSSQKIWTAASPESAYVATDLR